MKAAILTRFNQPLVIDKLSLPKLDYGQVLVKVFSSGICGAQLGHIAGVKVKKEFLPCLLGHEGGGRVVDIGLGVTTVKEGDKVVMHWRKGSGIESQFPKYKRKDSSIVGAGLITTFNEYAIVSENRLTAIEDGIPYEIAALMGCAVTTGLGIVNNEARLKIGQSLAIFGVGGVGLNIVQGASMVSGNPIIAIDINDEKLHLARNFGATHTINSTTYDVSEELKKILDSAEVDVFVDTTGRSELIEKSYEHTKGGGKTIMVGQPKMDDNLIFHSFLKHFRGKTLLDSDGGLTKPEQDIVRYSSLYKQGKLKLDELITRRCTLSELNEVLDDMRFNNSFTGRCIINFSTT